jgi:hypothetical protein
LPSLPRKYSHYLLDKPIVGRILKRGKCKVSSSVPGLPYSKKGFPATINVGTIHGVWNGMRFYNNMLTFQPDIYVISSSLNRSIVIISTSSKKIRKHFQPRANASQLLKIL